MQPNPYLGLDLDGLGRECGRIAIDLTTQRARTSEERQLLAEDTARLLIALNGHLGQLTSSSMPNSPARDHEAGASLAEAYDDFAESRSRNARHLALHLATERHLGPQTRPWYLDTRLDDVPAIELAVRSAAGLHRALEHLQQMPRWRR